MDLDTEKCVFNQYFLPFGEIFKDAYKVHGKTKEDLGTLKFTPIIAEQVLQILLKGKTWVAHNANYD